MKIILFIDYLCSGGAQRQLIELAKLIKDNISTDVHVVTYHRENTLESELCEQKISVQTITETKNKFKRIFYILRYFRNEKPDIVVSFLNSPNIIACICHIFFPNFKLIVSERNTSQNYTISDMLRFFLYRQTEYVIPNSYSQYNYISKNAPSLRKKLKVITNCVDTDRYVIKNTTTITNPITILTVARITNQKNIPNYLSALKILKQQGISFMAKWYGRYDDEALFRQSKHLIKEYNLEDVFKFCGESTDLLPIYHDADIFCLPSLYEGFPNVICEAMSSGLPIACSNVCDNPIIVNNEINGILFDPLNPQSIADGLKRCIKLASERQSTIGINNRKKMLSLCSKESFINKYKDLIK